MQCIGQGGIYIMQRRMLINLGLCGQPMLAPDTGANGGGADTVSASSGTEGTTGTEEAGEGKEGTSKSFDDILKDKTYQSEFDKKVAEALETAKSKWETEKATELENAKTEAQKLAKMNADQKAQYEAQKKIEALEKREKDITTRELKATAYETLAEKNLPKELIGTLNFADAESCNASIEAVEKAFQSAVEKAVNDKLRGNGTPKGNNGGNNGDNPFNFNFTGVRAPEKTK